MTSPDKLAASAEALVAALARTGDRAAFAELVRRRQAWLRRLLRQLSGDAALADDLAQRAFLDAWGQIGRLRDPKRFGAWLRRIAVNRWRKHLRRNDPLRAAAPADAEASTSTARPDLAMDVAGALAALAPDPRLCVVLTHLEGMSHGEVAAATGLPLGTVKSHVRRAAERLRESLSAYHQAPSQEVSDVDR